MGYSRIRLFNTKNNMNPNHYLYFNDIQARDNFYENSGLLLLQKYQYSHYIIDSIQIKYTWTEDHQGTTHRAFNYMSITNYTDNDVKENTFYYFITDMKYINYYNVEFYVKLDTMTTFFIGSTVKPSYIQRMSVNETLDNAIGTLCNTQDFSTNLHQAFVRTILPFNEHDIYIRAFIIKAKAMRGTLDTAYFNGYNTSELINMWVFAPKEGEPLTLVENIKNLVNWLDVYSQEITSFCVAPLYIFKDESRIIRDKVDDDDDFFANWYFDTTRPAESQESYEDMTITFPSVIIENVQQYKKIYSSSNSKLILYIGNNKVDLDISYLKKSALNLRVLYHFVGEIGVTVILTNYKNQTLYRYYSPMENIITLPISKNNLLTDLQKFASVALPIISSGASIGLGVSMAAIPKSAAIGMASTITGATSGLGQIIDNVTSLYYPNTFEASSKNTQNLIALSRFGVYLEYLIPENVEIERLTNLYKIYGYPVNRMENTLPQYAPKFNYIQGNINCITNAPFKYQEEIQKIFREGVTLWKNYDEMLNYNVNNYNG